MFLFDVGWLVFGRNISAVVTGARQQGTHFYIDYRFDADGQEIKGHFKVSQPEYWYLTDSREQEKRRLVVKHWEVYGWRLSAVPEYESTVGRLVGSLCLCLIVGFLLGFAVIEPLMKDHVERRLYIEGDVVPGRFVSKKTVNAGEMPDYWDVVYEFQDPVSREWIRAKVKTDFVQGQNVPAELTVLFRPGKVGRSVPYELGGWELDV
jgi:hypothetical protein